MQFTSRTVRSRPGLTQEEALNSLQSSSTFKPGTRIASIRRRGDRWVADLLEPKTADFPPSKDEGGEKPDFGGGDEAPAEDGPPSEDSGSDDGDDGGDKKKSESKELSQVLDILHTITDALGIPQPDAGMEDMDPDGAGAPPPGLDGPPPPHGAGGPPPPGAGPAVPGPTPMGATAFSSVQHEASCPTCQGIAGKTRTMTASIHDPQGLVKAAGAHQDLTATYGPQGYKVAQLVRDGEYVRALLRRS